MSKKKTNDAKLLTLIGIWNGLFSTRDSAAHMHCAFLSRLTLDTKLFAKFFRKKLRYRVFYTKADH